MRSGPRSGYLCASRIDLQGQQVTATRPRATRTVQTIERTPLRGCTRRGAGSSAAVFSDASVLKLEVFALLRIAQLSLSHDHPNKATDAFILFGL